MIFDNRRGTVVDLLTVMIVLFVFGVSIVIGFTLYSNLVNSGGLTTVPEASKVAANTLGQFEIYDNLFIAALIILSLTSVVAAARVRTSPLFFALSILLLAIVIFVGVGVADAFNVMTTGNELSATRAVFTKLFFVMDNLALYLLGMGVLITIALYSFRGGTLGL